MTSTRSDRIKELQRECDKIQTCEDLVAFVDSLEQAVEDKIFTDHVLVSYLDSVATVLFCMEGEAPAQPDWKLFGTTLFKAFFR
jgi:hypothetical protein